MTPENRNLIMAVALSMIVLLGWQMFVIQPEMEREAAEQERIAAEMAKSVAGAQATGQPNVSSATGTPTIGGSAAAPKAVETAKRIVIDAPLVRGSFSVRGARLDDVILTGYKESLDADSDNIHFLQKTSSDMPFFAE
ncbi:MAG: membrane protein insertase YidC, partial [Candidatus Puniceispirillaceae bacterium]